MIFEDNFFDKLPSDLYQALDSFYKRFSEFNLSLKNENQEMRSYEDYIDAYSAIEAFITANNLKDKYKPPELSNDKENNIKLIKAYYSFIHIELELVKNANIIESSKFKYQSKLNNIFCYKFTDGDLKRIQELINELRDQITGSELFAANHRERLLLRLEGLQKELHKRVSNLDKFWGLVGDAGVVIGKFGNDVKPIVDRIKEITQIVWRTQASSEELPSGSSMPMLK